MSSIRSRLLVWFLTIAIAPVLAVTLVVVLLSRHILREQVQTDLQQLADVTGSEVGKYLETELERAELVAALPNVVATTAGLSENIAWITASPDAYQELLTGLSNDIPLSAARFGFNEVSIFDTAGHLLFSSTNHPLGADYLSAASSKPELNELLAAAAQTESAVIQATPDGVSALQVGVKIQQEGQHIGFLVVEIPFDDLQTILNRPSYFGETTEAILVMGTSEQVRILGEHFHKDQAEEALPRIVTPESNDAAYLLAAVEGDGGVGLATDHHNTPVIASWRPLSVKGWGIAVKQDTAETFQSTTTQASVSYVMIGVTVIIVSFVAISVAQSYSDPIVQLSEAVEAIASGNLGTRVLPLARKDEIAKLADGFNTMAGWLTSLIVDFEQRLQERTNRLVQRTRQLQAAAEVSGKIAALRDTDELLQLVAKTIHESFELYFVGILLVDDNDESKVVLRAAAGGFETSSLMKEGVISASDKGIIAWVVANMEGRVAADISRDPLFLSNPILPNTKSEMALPLQRDGKLLGVLDVQSDSKDQFDQSDIQNLQSMADQIAIALDNSRLYRESLAYARDMVRAWEAAEEANKAKSIFLANMSHELRTPLNAIIGFAQMMERDASLTSRQSEYMQIIQRSGQHLLSLINNVLEVSKIEAGHVSLQPSAFDLHNLLHDVFALFEIRARAKRLELTLDIDPCVPRHIQADSQKLRQILINLLSNALKFTHIGSVALRLVCEASAGESRWLMFEVADTGEGIERSELAKVFEPFEQTRSGLQSQEGTGLGLTISRQFVELMGGEISIDSQPRVGTTVRFRLPLVEAVAAEVETPAAVRRVVEIQGGQTYRILVADDAPETRRLMHDWLTSVGFEVRTAANGLQALELYASWQPDLIWMDMRMPVMDGYEAVRRLKAQFLDHTPPIIALTGSAFEQERADILTEGCDDFVRKPLDEQMMLEKVAEHLGISYVYEVEVLQPTTVTFIEPTPAQEAETTAALQNLPFTYLSQLQLAVDKLDINAAQLVLADIKELDENLGEQLAELLADFRFDKLQVLLKGAIVNE